MDLFLLIDKIKQFRAALANRQVLTAISLAGEIAQLVAKLIGLYRPTTPVVGHQQLAAELEALRHPDQPRLLAAAAQASPVQGFGGDFLHRLAQIVIDAIETLLNFKKADPVATASPDVAATVAANVEPEPAAVPASPDGPPSQEGPAVVPAAPPRAPRKPAA